MGRRIDYYYFNYIEQLGAPRIYKKSITEDGVTREITYQYDESNYVSKVIEKKSSGYPLQRTYKYPASPAYVGTSYQGSNELRNRNMLALPLEERIQDEDRGTHTLKKNYYELWNSKAVLKKVEMNQYYQGGSDKEWQYMTYSTSGRPQTVESSSGVKQGYLWGYNNTRPVAVVKNATNRQPDDSELLEFFFECFEENGNTTTNPHTGKKVKSGDYTVYFTPGNTRKYILTYWYRLSGGMEICRRALYRYQ